MFFTIHKPVDVSGVPEPFQATTATDQDFTFTVTGRLSRSN